MFLIKKYNEIWTKHGKSPSCQVSYTNSRKKEITLTLNEVIARLFKLSFDPYMCPELRWGATPKNAAEFASCPDSKYKLKWYSSQQKLRNRIERIYGVPTPLSFGPSESPKLQITELLDSLAQKHAVTAKAPVAPLRDHDALFCPLPPNHVCQDVD